MNFKNKVVVITGGSQGFGKSLARVLRSQGAVVVISSEDINKLAAAAKELDVDHFKADVASPEELNQLAKYARSKHKRIDVWINNAGIQIAPTNVENVAIEKLHKLFEINFFGYFYGCQIALRVMREQGNGAIINVNSTAGLDGKPGISAYASSKFAVKGLTQSMRAELKGVDIQVFGIHPGGMQTEIYKEKYPPDFEDYMTVEYAIQKIMDNFSKPAPELDLVIRRPVS